MKILLMFKPVFNFLLVNLSAIQNPDLLAKFKGTLMISLSIFPISFLIEKITGWYMLNYAYVSFVLIAVFIDHFLGTWVHAFIDRDFDIKKNVKGFVVKCTMVFVVGFLVEGFKYMSIESNVVLEYFTWLSRTMVFVYPTGSALKNCSIVTNGKFPPIAFMKKFSRFNKDLDPRVFGQQPEKQEENAPDNI